MEPDFDYLPRPTLLRNLGFWLVAVLLGAVLLFPVALVTGAAGDLEVLSGSILISIPLSLAALPLLLPTLPWALTADSVPGRWGRLVLLQVAALLWLIALAYGLPGGAGFAVVGWVVGPVFSVGGLLAARLVYAQWL